MATKQICIKCLKFAAYCECAGGPRFQRHPSSCECAACAIGSSLLAGQPGVLDLTLDSEGDEE